MLEINVIYSICSQVHHVEQRSVLEIAVEMRRLQALAAEGKLGEGELRGGTFTLSNIGAIGGTYASPVLVAPQVLLVVLYTVLLLILVGIVGWT